MTTYFEAANRNELLSKVNDHDISIDKRSAQAEKLQINSLLRFKAERLNYPIRVDHNSASTFPDFFLFTGGKTILVEATRITNEEIHRSRSLNLEGSQVVSSLYIQGRKRKNSELRDDLQPLTQQFLEAGNTISQEEEFWRKQMFKAVGSKTQKLNVEGSSSDENWLLLWDDLRSGLPEHLTVQIESAMHTTQRRKWHLIVWQDSGLNPAYFQEIHVPHASSASVSLSPSDL